MTGKPGQRKYDIEERMLAAACGIVDIVDSLARTRAGNHVAGQLVRSGTSPAANYAEAQSAESRKDFVHKLNVCLKELRETRVWLILVQRKSLSKTPAVVVATLKQIDELIGILRSSVRTAKENMRKAGVAEDEP